MIISSEDWAVTKTVRLSKRFTVTITVGAAGQLICEWDPDIPRRLRASELAAYRKARDELIEELAKHLGGGVVVVET